MTYKEANIKAIKISEILKEHPQLYSNQIMRIFTCFKECKKANNYLKFLKLYKNSTHDETVLFSNYGDNSSSSDFTVGIDSIVKGLISAKLYFEQLKITLPEFNIKHLEYLDCEEDVISN